MSKREGWVVKIQSKRTGRIHLVSVNATTIQKARDHMQYYGSIQIPDDFEIELQTAVSTIYTWGSINNPPAPAYLRDELTKIEKQARKLYKLLKVVLIAYRESDRSNDVSKALQKLLSDQAQRSLDAQRDVLLPEEHQTNGSNKLSSHVYAVSDLAFWAKQAQAEIDIVPTPRAQRQDDRGAIDTAIIYLTNVWRNGTGKLPPKTKLNEQTSLQNPFADFCEIVLDDAAKAVGLPVRSWNSRVAKCLQTKLG